METSQNRYKKFLIFLVGMFILTLGMTLALVWWQDFMGLLRGVSGIVLALAGLGILYTLRQKP